MCCAMSDGTSEDGSKGDTALKVAVTNNDPAMASMLMARGARIEVWDHTGLTVPALGWPAEAAFRACRSSWVLAGLSTKLSRYRTGSAC